MRIPSLSHGCLKAENLIAPACSSNEAPKLLIIFRSHEMKLVSDMHYDKRDEAFGAKAARRLQFPRGT